MEQYGAFRVIGELGRGGMGVVYLGVQEPLNRLVAIKVLGSADEALAGRLRHEAIVLADLQHPHVVGVIDVGEVDGRPYLVMPYMPGGTLGDVLRRDGSLRPGQVAGVVAALADALAAAHTRGVLHRDVKPGNVLLSAQGDPYLSDFGIATGSTQTKTSTGELLGTIGYVAPETISGQPVTAAADVYALGVLAYTALSGRGPVIADSLVAALEAARTGRHVPLEQAAPDTPPQLVALVQAAMAMDPLDRPGDLREYARSLRAAVPVEQLKPLPDRAAAMLAEESPTSLGKRASVRVSAEAATVSRRRPRRTTILSSAAGLALLGTGAVAALAGGLIGPATNVGEVEPSTPPRATASAAPSTPPAFEPSPQPPPGPSTAGDPGGPVTGDTSVAEPRVVQEPEQEPQVPVQPQEPDPPLPPKPQPTKEPPPPPQTVQRPSAVSSGYAAFQSVAARASEKITPTSVNVLLSWAKPTSGGAPAKYEVRRSVVTESSRSVQSTLTMTSTSRTLTVPANHTGFSRYSWEVRALNSGGASAWTELSGRVTNMIGKYGEDATQMARTSGGYANYSGGGGGERPAPSPDQSWRLYEQSPTGGTIQAGSQVYLKYYGD